MKRFLGLGLAALLAPTLASAEGFGIDTLGTLPTQEACLDKASTFAAQIKDEWGAHSVANITAGVIIYDLKNHNPHDLIVVCADGRASLVSSSSDDMTAESRGAIALQLVEVWKRLP